MGCSWCHDCDWPDALCKCEVPIIKEASPVSTTKINVDIESIVQAAMKLKAEKIDAAILEQLNISQLARAIKQFTDELIKRLSQ